MAREFDLARDTSISATFKKLLINGPRRRSHSHETENENVEIMSTLLNKNNIFSLRPPPPSGLFGAAKLVIKVTNWMILFFLTCVGTCAMIYFLDMGFRQTPARFPDGLASAHPKAVAILFVLSFLFSWNSGKSVVAMTRSLTTSLVFCFLLEHQRCEFLEKR